MIVVSDPPGSSVAGPSPALAEVTTSESTSGAVRGFSLIFVALGLVVLVLTLVNGGGPASVGFLMGLAFVGVGAGRLWISSRIER